MVPIIVIVTFIVFVVVDVLLRVSLRRLEERKQRQRREEALDEGLRLEFSEEAATLKRIEVDEPKARILAVDDERVVLDSFRKILVLAGYSIDTVETGPEALALVRKNDYDFVFVDLKMPEMDGLEVTKAVKHLRPDIDVAIITGYATVESAVKAMKYGAMDYVEKPFTEDELSEFAETLLIRRQERIARTTPPEIHLVTASAEESASPRVINVPGGVYLTPEHTWLSIETNGEARIGLDDFFHKAVGDIDDVQLPLQGARVKKGEQLFLTRHGDRTLRFPSPLSGRVSRVHQEVVDELDLMRQRPYDSGWICAIEPERLTEELRGYRIGADAIPWFQDEVRDLQTTLKRLAERRLEAAGDGSLEITEAAEDEVREAFAELCLEVEGRSTVGAS